MKQQCRRQTRPRQARRKHVLPHATNLAPFLLRPSHSRPATSNLKPERHHPRPSRPRLHAYTPLTININRTTHQKKTITNCQCTFQRSTKERHPHISRTSKHQHTKHRRIKERLIELISQIKGRERKGRAITKWTLIKRLVFFES